eukprot:CAMPEP_0172606906 /NCGR_PEP_ID=MMETSP1068-20121228/27099_1 /TAXON_ID=35684 /ORGANISM="Pseudopedinella elastica, Strain CCMP716" /LENGTH=404 /DNA_ID=CAMNT_0013409779 /DNA_START=41 /DNA_END=1255 /DNA_ORIENTATION=-
MSLSKLVLRQIPRKGSRAFGGEAAIPTALYDLHVSLKGKMVPFAGYSLPVLYENEDGGVVKEHLHTRAAGCASLFDVSHMGQLMWYGKDRLAFLETLLVGDIKGTPLGEGKLSLITNAQGGIIDDTIVQNASEDMSYMVVNGACKHKDMAHFKEQLASFQGDATFEYRDDLSLVAVQGPGAMAAVQKLVPSNVDLTKVGFMVGFPTELAGISGCRLTRCGYTGEDGFELSVPNAEAAKLAEAILADTSVKPAGLGARDSLRLEAGLCLYGNDLDDTTTPIEGNLTWTIGGPKTRRRTEQGFLGAEHFLTPEGKLKKTSRKRVGLAGMKAPAREGAEIFVDDEKVGVVTSGTFSPTLKKPIAMGYVSSDLSKEGTEVSIKVRNKMQPAVVTKMPFVETGYYRVPE